MSAQQSAQAAGAAAATGKPSANGGASGSGGSIAVGVPVYTSPSGNASVGAAAGHQWQRGGPSSSSVGVGFRLRF